VLLVFASADVAPVSQEKIFGAFEDRLAGLGGFPVFARAHFIDDPVNWATIWNRSKNDLDVRGFGLHRHDLGVPNVHHYSFQLLPLLLTHAREKAQEVSCFAVFADPNHQAGLAVENYGQVAVTFAHGDFVDGQDAKPLVIGLPKLFFQELLVDSLDCCQVQPHMTGGFLDSHELAEVENITRQSAGHPQIRVEKLQLFGRNLLTVGTNDLPIMAVNPDSRRPKVQISPGSLLAVDPCGWPYTDMAARLESLVGDCLQVSLLAIAGDSLPEETDSRKGEIMCYS